MLGKIAKPFFLCACMALTLTAPVTALAEQESQEQLGHSVKEQIPFALGYLTTTSHLLAFIAKEEGYFSEEGLDVELIPFASAGELATGLEVGKLNVALIGSVPSITFQSNGHDLTIFGGAMTNGHGYVIKPEFVPADREPTIEDLKGRNVASVKNSIQDLELLILLKKHNLEIGEGPDKVNIVYFNSQKDAFASMQGKEIDAVSFFPPFSSIAQANGYRVIFHCKDVDDFHNQPCCRQVAESSAIDERKDDYIHFERAFIKAYIFYKTNHEKTIQDVKKYVNLAPETLDFEIYGGFTSNHPDPDKQATTKLKKQVVDAGYANDYDIEKLYNTSIYEQALASLIKENPDDPILKDLQEHFNKFQ
jgi:NitT/TauT family transport system substrate-binding protein